MSSKEVISTGGKPHVHRSDGAKRSNGQAGPAQISMVVEFGLTDSEYGQPVRMHREVWSEFAKRFEHEKIAPTGSLPERVLKAWRACVTERIKWVQEEELERALKAQQAVEQRLRTVAGGSANLRAGEGDEKSTTRDRGASRLH